MKSIEKVYYVIIFCFVIAGVLISRYDVTLYEGLYAKEDGLIEWLTAFALIFGSAICFTGPRFLNLLEIISLFFL